MANRTRLIHWKPQSFKTACEIRDTIKPEQIPLVATTGEAALLFATVSQRFRYTNEFPIDRWRLVGKEDSKGIAIRLRYEINHEGLEIACIAESRNPNVPWAVMAADRKELR